jgi:hypothetical protein
MVRRGGALHAAGVHRRCDQQADAASLDGIAWLIAGGESGAGARPIKEEWVISLRDQCQISKVPFFFKQWGGVQKKRHGRLLQGLTYSEMPELIQSAVPNRNFRRQLIDQFSIRAASSCSDHSFPKLKQYQ